MLTVFGSINLDVCVRSVRLPQPGQTLLGSDALLSPGGKGANQAHAARRFGVPTRLLGMVGQDAFAAPALALLREADVDLSGVGVEPAAPTGLALITLDEAGENTIVVAPGANQSARAAQVPDAVLRDSRVLLLQLELPWTESQALAWRARLLGCKVVLNASPLPLRGALPPLEAIDLLIVNGVELEQLCEQHGIVDSDPPQRARRLARLLHLDVLATFGAGGSLLSRADGHHVQAATPRVQAVDTTGAGDTYAGVLCAALATGEAPERAMALASTAAALACQRPGAQAAQPSRDEIDKHITREEGTP